MSNSRKTTCHGIYKKSLFLDIFQRSNAPPSVIGLSFTVLVLGGVIVYGAVLFQQYRDSVLKESEVTFTSECISARFQPSSNGSVYIEGFGKVTQKANPELKQKVEVPVGESKPIKLCAGADESIYVASSSCSFLKCEYGENLIMSGISDGTYGYYGTDTTPGIVIKVRLSDLKRIGALTLNAEEDGLMSAVIDESKEYGYFGTYTDPGKVVKVNLKNMTRVGALTMDTPDNRMVSAVRNGESAVFFTMTSPSVGIKIHLSNMTRIGRLVLNTDENEVRSIVAVGRYAYCGTKTDVGRIVKIDMDSMTRIDAILLNTGEKSLISAITDGTHAYFGTYTDPGIVIKVLLSNLTRMGALAMNSREKNLYTSCIDGNFGFFGTYSNPGRVVKVRLSDLANVGSITLNEGEDGLRSSIVAGEYGYFAGWSSPGVIVRIRLSNLARFYSPIGTLSVGESNNPIPRNLLEPASSFYPVKTIDLSGSTSYSVILSSPNVPSDEMYPCDLNDDKNCAKINLTPTMMHIKYLRQYSIETIAGALGGAASVIFSVARMIVMIIRTFRKKNENENELEMKKQRV